jgi:hypothetical protein
VNTVQQSIDAIINQGSLAVLKGSDRQRWIRYSLENPKDLRFRTFLLENFWQKGNFKDVLDLLPPIGEQNLELALKWHTQAHLRMAIDGGSVKKLIPMAISYAAFLPENLKSALLRLVETLVRSRNSSPLVEYFETHLEIAKLVREKIAVSVGYCDPKLTISPEILAKCFPETSRILNQSLSPSPIADYFAPGGYLLLLYKGEFFNETPEVGGISDDIKFRLDLVRVLHRKGRLENELKPYLILIRRSTRTQIALVSELLQRYSEILTEESRISGAKKELSSVALFLGDLITNTDNAQSSFRGLANHDGNPKLISEQLEPTLRLFTLQLQSALVTADIEKINNPMIVSCLNYNLQQSTPKEYTEKFEKEYIRIIVAIVGRAGMNGDSGFVVQLLNEEPPVKAIVKTVILKIIDELLDDETGPSKAKDLQIADFFAKVLTSVGGQKSRLKKLQKKIKQLESKLWW